MNAHDLDAFVACSLRATAASSQRIQAERSRAATRCGINWTGVFSGVPDFSAELLFVRQPPTTVSRSGNGAADKRAPR